MYNFAVTSTKIIKKNTIIIKKYLFKYVLNLDNPLVKTWHLSYNNKNILLC